MNTLSCALQVAECRGRVHGGWAGLLASRNLRFLEGTCHYLEGNLRAAHRIHQVAVILNELKLGEGRIALLHVDSGGSDLFRQSVQDFIRRIQALGPNPLKQAA